VHVRVGTYNVQSFRAGADAVAEVIGPEQPDVLLVQECGSRRALRRLAQTLDMGVESTHRPFGRVRNAVLFRSPWRAGAVQVGRFSPMGRALLRGFIAVHLRRAGVPFVAVSVHLGLVPREREAHARELTDFLSGLDDPVVVGVDLNEETEAPAARWIGERMFDVCRRPEERALLTFPGRIPTARIEFIFVSAQVRPQRAWVPVGPVTASDHRPVLADLEVPEP
jgi:endonuclease/exonuclease/phosphatase family metal-dependent hydrolase